MCNHGCRKDFFWGGKVDFSRCSQKDFPMGAKIGEILFYPLESKKTTFFAKNLIGRCHISKSSSDAHVCNHIHMWPVSSKVYKSNFDKVYKFNVVLHGKLYFRHALCFFMKGYNPSPRKVKDSHSSWWDLFKFLVLVFKWLYE